MTKIRVTKEYNFEMAHALWNYDGLCRNIHGHSYRLFVTVIGDPIEDVNNPKYGMVIDFGDLKKIIFKNVIERLDHTVLLCNNSSAEIFKNAGQMFDRLEIVEYQPTCENMVIDFVNRIKAELPDSVTLHSLKLYETARSYAEWFASDQ